MALAAPADGNVVADAIRIGPPTAPVATAPILDNGFAGYSETGPWSSYGAHGLGRRDPLLSPLPAWAVLVCDEAARQAKVARVDAHTAVGARTGGRPPLRG